MVQPKVAVVGLGKAGLPLACVMADASIEVVGVDVDEARCELINSGKNPIPEEPELGELLRRHGGSTLRATPRYEDASCCTAFILIPPVFIDEGRDPDFCHLEAASRGVGKLLKRGDLVVLETTVPPGTTESLVRRWLEEESGLSLGEFFLAHSPERIMTGFSISRLREFPKVVGGVDPDSGRRAFELYSKFVPNLHLVSSAKVAEFVKVMEGCYRDVNVALANELFKIAEELGVDFFEARRFANHEFCHIHLPSTGVGGHCIPVYPWFLIREAEKKGKFGNARLLRAAREINDGMVEHWAERILLLCSHVSKPLSQIRVCLRGIAFRQGVKDACNSRNLALAMRLQELGLQVYVDDGQYQPEELARFGLRHMDSRRADIVFDPFSLELTVRR